MHSVHDLFKQVNITFPSPYERLHFINRFKFQPLLDKTFSHYVVFTFDHLILQVCRRYLAAVRISKSHDGKPEDYALYFKVNQTDFAIFQTTNCLFEQENDKCDKDADTKKYVSPFKTPVGNKRKRELIENLNEALVASTKSPEPEKGSILFILSLALLLMFSSLTILLFVKSYGRFGSKSTETQLE